MGCIGLSTRAGTITKGTTSSLHVLWLGDGKDASRLPRTLRHGHVQVMSMSTERTECDHQNGLIPVSRVLHVHRGIVKVFVIQHDPSPPTSWPISVSSSIPHLKPSQLLLSTVAMYIPFLHYRLAGSSLLPQSHDGKGSQGHSSSENRSRSDCWRKSRRAR